MSVYSLESGETSLSTWSNINADRLVLLVAFRYQMFSLSCLKLCSSEFVNLPLILCLFYFHDLGFLYEYCSILVSHTLSLINLLFLPPQKIVK